MRRTLPSRHPSLRSLAPVLAFALTFVALLTVSSPTSASLVINEIHHSPSPRQNPVEFVEIHNPTLFEIPIHGWQLSGAVQFTFPDSSPIPPGGFIVVAQNPAAVAAHFQIPLPFGPWSGALSGDGEILRLLDPSGATRDRVNYQLGFPWPVVGGSSDLSIELIHPSLDNSLGGNWRASALGDTVPDESLWIPSGATWRYQKGGTRPSNPIAAWRAPEFDDSAWPQAAAPIGYDPDVRLGAPLNDMRGAYQTFFLRHEFSVVNAATQTQLRLAALYDDGFKVWLNGALLRAVNAPAADEPWDAPALATREDNGFETLEIPLPPGLLKNGRNVLAVQVFNINRDSSSDAFFDARLSTLEAAANRGPTPGRQNITFTTNAPPAVRQVQHSPKQPASNATVEIQCKVSDPDGVQSVSLEYQVVAPGDYIERSDPAFRSAWTALPMQPVAAIADLYSAVLPSTLQQHRSLIRYRIRASDRLGAARYAPDSDAPEPNFAYFVYDGAPEWTGAVRPGNTAPFTVSKAEMNRLPIYHLIAKKKSVEDCTWFDRSHGDEYFWTGALVYDGEVYDHIRFRPRGGVWRYAMGKNMWKFDFNRGHDFRARDPWGRRFENGWSKLNLGACIQQGDYLHRGEQGLFESVGFRLFQLAGVPASHTAFVHFRIIDDALETHPTSQYQGDFWGLYLAVEQLDGQFLKEHGLEDGNLYKMESGTGDANHLGKAGPVDSSDLSAFLNAYGGNNHLSLDEAWWRSRLDLPTYYNYQAIVQTIHHYDIADGKNYFYHRDPSTQLWRVLPWDLDLTWSDNMYRAGQQGGDEPFKLRVLSNFNRTNPRFPTLNREFRNRVRELRDLLLNPDQTGQLIDEYARIVRGAERPSFIDADRAQWDYHPALTNTAISLANKAGHGRFYQSGVGSKSFEGMIQKMKNYIAYRATDPAFSLDMISAESGLPNQPALSYQGDPHFAADALQFSVSPFSGSSFRALRWRLARITRPDHPSFNPALPLPYEIDSLWETTESSPNNRAVLIPPNVVRAGALYRLRAQFVDSEGRASRWSDPIEFTVSPSSSEIVLAHNLRITEIHYNPAGDGIEFIELHNRSVTQSLSLAGVRLASAIEFTFPPGVFLPPQGYLVVCQTADLHAFRTRFAVPPKSPLYGPYSGSLSNGGETLELLGHTGSRIAAIPYNDQPPWPSTPDGGGPSLVPTPDSEGSSPLPSHWQASASRGGSPGRIDPASTIAPNPVLHSWTRAGNTLHLSIHGPIGSQCTLETSANLKSWSPLLLELSPGWIELPLRPNLPSQFLRIQPR